MIDNDVRAERVARIERRRAARLRRFGARQIVDGGSVAYPVPLTGAGTTAQLLAARDILSAVEATAASARQLVRTAERSCDQGLIERTAASLVSVDELVGNLSELAQQALVSLAAAIGAARVDEADAQMARLRVVAWDDLGVAG